MADKLTLDELDDGLEGAPEENETDGPIRQPGESNEAWVIRASAWWEAHKTEEYSEAVSTPSNVKAAAGAYRGNMLKRLRKVYDNYQQFDAIDAAARTRYDHVAEIKNYLALEAARPTSRIRPGSKPGFYYIIDPFQL